MNTNKRYNGWFRNQNMSGNFPQLNFLQMNLNEYCKSKYTNFFTSILRKTILLNLRYKMVRNTTYIQHILGFLVNPYTNSSYLQGGKSNRCHHQHIIHLLLVDQFLLIFQITRTFDVLDSGIP